MRAVFVHGSGSAGADAWPLQCAALPQAHFLERLAPGDDPDLVAPLVAAALGEGGHLVAMSYGGIVAMRVASAHPGLVRSLTLLEPACLVLARGRPGVEEHVAGLAPVFGRRIDPSFNDEQFSAAFSRATGMPVPDLPAPVLEATTRRLRATRPPWELDVDASVAATTPTLVVTGGRGDMYDEVADVLEQAGARRATLTGFGHRVHDHPEATATMLRFWAAVDRG
jgi:pimeloyl-ACP methyl ester carboxylesterase